MRQAWQTPRGARPNRRGELARLDECFRESEKTPFTAAQAAGKDEPSGRLLDPGREAGARGMIVTEHCCKVVHRTESGLGSSPANYPIVSMLGIVTRSAVFTSAKSAPQSAAVSDSISIAGCGEIGNLGC